jgi:hypothetical protein
MTDYRSIKYEKSFKNIKDVGTTGTGVATGTTAQRGTVEGTVRVNSTTSLFEYYQGGRRYEIDLVPQIDAVGNTNISEADISAGYDLTITGANLIGVVVDFISDDGGTTLRAPSTSYTSSTSITARVHSSVNAAGEPWDVKVASATGLSATLSNAFNVNSVPSFGVASGSLGTLTNNDLASSNITTVTATDPESDAITFSIVSGSIPAGVTFNSNGTWSGTATAVASDTTSNFTVRATDAATPTANTADRAYSVLINRGAGNPTSVNNVNPSEDAIDAGFDLIITGTNFLGTQVAKFKGASEAVVTATSTTVDSATQITARLPTTVTHSNEPWDVQIVNGSYIGTDTDAFNVNLAPVWSTGAGSLGSINDNATGTHFTVAATDPEGSLTYSVTSGSLPGGLSLGSGNGQISGDPTDVGTPTTSNFDISVTDGVNNAVARSFAITVNPVLFVAATGGSITTSGDYKIHKWTASDSTGLNVSSAGNAAGANTIDVMLVAGGGGGGTRHAGAGGGGGISYFTGATVSVTNYPVVIGGGGGGNSVGSNSTFLSETGSGGGGGGYFPGACTGDNGGSGGGAGSWCGSQNTWAYGGSATQATPSAGSSNTGYGQAGGNAYGWGGNHFGGGGGGGGSAGANSGSTGPKFGGNGGGGKQLNLDGNNYYWAGGGGGSAHGGGPAGNGGTGGGGGGGADSGASPPGSGGGSAENSGSGGSGQYGGNGGTNTGGGGGGSSQYSSGSTGGSGMLLVKYKFQ